MGILWDGEGNMTVTRTQVGLAVAALAVVASSGWYWRRSSQRTQLITKVQASPLYNQALQMGLVKWNLPTRAAEVLPLFDMNTVDEAYLILMDDVRAALPADMKVLGTSEMAPESIKLLATAIAQQTGIDPLTVWDNIPDIPGIDIASWWSGDEKK